MTGRTAMVPPLIFILHSVYNFNKDLFTSCHLILKVTVADFNMKMMRDSANTINNSANDAMAKKLTLS